MVECRSFPSVEANVATLINSGDTILHSDLIGSLDSLENGTFCKNQNADRIDDRPSRSRHHSKRVPNLLAGVPLLSGPVTPNFVSTYSPEFDQPGVGQYHSVAMFPSFMLAPSLLAEADGAECFPSLTNVPGVYPSTSALYDSRRPRRERQKVLPKKDHSPVFDSSVDFPELRQQPLSSVSCKKLSPVKFPRKQQSLF